MEHNGTDATAQRADERNNLIRFKNCVPFTSCINNINNTQVDNAKDLDVVMLLYNLIEYSNKYAEISGSFFYYEISFRKKLKQTNLFERNL